MVEPGEAATAVPIRALGFRVLGNIATPPVRLYLIDQNGNNIINVFSEHFSAVAWNDNKWHGFILEDGALDAYSWAFGTAQGGNPSAYIREVKYVTKASYDATTRTETTTTTVTLDGSQTTSTAVNDGSGGGTTVAGGGGGGATTTTVQGGGATTTTLQGGGATTTTLQGGGAGGMASGSGDPHLVNVFGQRFDLYRPGTHVLAQVPRGAHPNATLLHLEADVQQVGGACAEMYFKSIRITGQWVPEHAGLHFGCSQHQRRLGQWMQLGRVQIKVAYGSTAEGTEYLNIFVKHLNRAGFPVGGLLGEDDHTAESTPSRGCKRAMSLLQSA